MTTTDPRPLTLPGQAAEDRPQNGTDVLIVGAAAPTGQAQGDSAGRGRVETPVASTEPVTHVPGSDGRPAGAFEVRCPNCHALQFLARARWECVAIDEATVAIKCWRRTCKRVLGLRPQTTDCRPQEERAL